MKKLIASEPRVATFKDYDDPQIKSNEVRIKVTFASPKHGTEVVDFRGISPFIEEEYSEEWRMFVKRKESEANGMNFAEFELGNMVVGEIIEKGSDVIDYNSGDKVCTYGPISETVTVNAIDNHRLRKIPNYNNWKNAVCYDPAQFALGGLRDANVRAGDFVVVSGLGAIGQIAIQLAKKAGASVVIGVDPLENRRNIARKHGADYCFNPIECDIGYEVKKVTNKVGADSIIETSGHKNALQFSLRAIGYGGTISYVAFAKEFPEGLNFGREAHFNNAKIVFSRAASEPNPDYPRWNRRRIEDVCWELLMSDYINCEDIISPVVPFEDSAEAYCKYVDREPEMSIKMGVEL